MLPAETLYLALSRSNVAYSSQSQRLHSVEWARAASGSWSRKVAERASPTCVAGGGCVLWRCPTLPHPPRCSTIGACGLSFQVRNGGWAFPRGYDHHKMVQPYSLQCPERVPRACWPRVGGWGFVLVVIRIVATSTFLVSVNRLWLMCVFSVGPLVPVGSRAPRGASTSGLSTR